MKLFILYQTDNWKSKASRISFGVFDTGAKANESAKWQELCNSNSKVVVQLSPQKLFKQLRSFFLYTIIDTFIISWIRCKSWDQKKSHLIFESEMGFFNYDLASLF